MGLGNCIFELEGVKSEPKEFRLAETTHLGYRIALNLETDLQIKFAVHGTYMTSKLILKLCCYEKKLNHLT